ncbi:MAG: hypothetical protein D3914_16240, partial [Candidatus Electrothrix sp. LOE2]|nr:hypothetical protein [Candidatus Electrothrix sp. LOE2]
GTGSKSSIDFGYKPVGGMLGDTVYWDANGDGSQGQFEQGIAGVEVELYTFTDADGDGRYDVGETLSSSPVKTATTDANGNYLFYGLPNDNYAVKVISGTGTPIGTAQLTADPGADGVVCPAAGSMCDEVHGVKIEGNSYMGADFGYQPPGVIGDQLWIDTDADGVMDAGEPPLAFVEIELQHSGCTAGTNCPTTVTDSSGNYSFINLTAGTEYKVVVNIDTNDLDYPFPADLVATYDLDGGTDSQAKVTATAGIIDTVDFGYRYNPVNNLSGTVCLEPTLNGVCGSGGSGVGSGETAYVNVPVYVSKWTDSNGDGNIDRGELISLGQTVTNAVGDYTFNGLPSVNGTNERYVVSLAAPEDYIELTTTASDTPAEQVKKNPDSGDTVSALQFFSVADGSSTNGLDFAFKETASFDYGDLPTSYATLKEDNGARHIVPATPNL